MRRSDLDINRHANNRAIAEWVLEAIPPEIAKSHEIEEMEISYKGQAFYEDVIISGCEISNNKELYTCQHHIKNKQSGQLITVARTQWRKTQKNSGGFR
ncbi:MAG: thioesterase [Candidatus Marinimicrobia bacterium]|nr:thioesterase [Candidatus Neomarinimicrobiota bacterium]